MKLGVVIVAGGSSKRAGFDKLLADLHGLPVLAHTVNAFLRCACVCEVVVVSTQERFDSIVPCLLPTDVHINQADGGAERQDSVLAGVNALQSAPDLIAVHDGARPLVAVEAIMQCAQVAMECGAAALAHPVVETLKRANDDAQTLPEDINRENLWVMETPQIFCPSLLKNAYECVKNAGLVVTDEVSALEHAGTPTQLVHNPQQNIKITFPQDVSAAHLIMMESMNFI